MIDVLDVIKVFDDVQQFLHTQRFISAELHHVLGPQVDARDGKFFFKDMGKLADKNVASHDVSPTVVDWNGDGILDLFFTSVSSTGTVTLERLGYSSGRLVQKEKIVRASVGKGWTLH